METADSVNGFPTLMRLWLMPRLARRWSHITITQSPDIPRLHGEVTLDQSGSAARNPGGNFYPGRDGRGYSMSTNDDLLSHSTLLYSALIAFGNVRSA
jgi:hypothetical protein